MSNTRTPASKAKRDQDKPAGFTDFDTWEREDSKTETPFVAKIGGKMRAFKNPADMPYRLAKLVVELTDLDVAFAGGLSEDDATEVLALDLSVAKMAAITVDWTAHYGITAETVGNGDASPA